MGSEGSGPARDLRKNGEGGGPGDHLRGGSSGTERQSRHLSLHRSLGAETSPGSVVFVFTWVFLPPLHRGLPRGKDRNFVLQPEAPCRQSVPARLDVRTAGPLPLHQQGTRAPVLWLSACPGGEVPIQAALEGGAGEGGQLPHPFLRHLRARACLPQVNTGPQQRPVFIFSWVQRCPRRPGGTRSPLVPPCFEREPAMTQSLRAQVPFQSLRGGGSLPLGLMHTPLHHLCSRGPAPLRARTPCSAPGGGSPAEASPAQLQSALHLHTYQSGA